MSKSIKPEELSKTILDYLKNYRENIQEDVEEVTDKVTKEARDELKKISPRKKVSKAIPKRKSSSKKKKVRENPYYKGWSVKISKRGATKYHKVIWNKTNYQLTHLLEFGHATRNGGRTKAIPHIRPVEEKYKVKFVDLVEERIRRRSR